MQCCKLLPPFCKSQLELTFKRCVCFITVHIVALRRFKKDVSKSGHLFELRRRRYFETNTEKRIRKAAAARRKAKIARNETRKNSSRSGGSAKSRSPLSTAVSSNSS